MKKLSKSLIVLLIIILIALLYNLFFFTVGEAEQAVITRFGAIEKVIVSEENYELVKEQLKNDYPQVEVLKGKGLFVKTPFIDSVQLYSAKLFTYDTSPREVITKDKKKILVDNNAQWRIVNPVLFKVSVGTEESAHVRIDDILYSKLNEKVGLIDASVLISDKDYVYNMLDEITDECNSGDKTDKNNAGVLNYGIQIMDTRIKRTDLPEQNNENIFNRMRTEREQMAKQYRSEGKEEAMNIKSQADKEAVIIEAEAYKQAQTIRGEGDAEAIRIYNEAYNKDPEFYEFYRTLEAYKKSFINGGKTTIIIDKNSPFAKFLFGE